MTSVWSEDRLAGLLAANRSVVSELALPAVLRRIVDAARAVAGAEFAALGVIGADGRLEQFVHTGMDAATVERIGHLPTGIGVLGAVIDEAAPIRLHSIAGDRRATGFPAGHPAMRTFLGVPVRSRGQVFGNLYLADRIDGADFSADDEDLVVALAATAGIAIENARLYEESRRRQEWLRASAEISRDLLRPGLGDAVLVRIADAVLRLSDADAVTIDFPVTPAGVAAVDHDFPPTAGTSPPDESPYAGELVVEVARGVGAGSREGVTYPAAASLAGRAMRERRAVLTSEPDAHGSAPAGAAANAYADGLPGTHTGTGGPAMACPLVGEAGVRGAVVVMRREGRPPFGRGDVEMAEQLATHAAVALELADRRADEERVAVLEDRQRIARDLHDHVIQRIFATGLTLDSVSERTGTLSPDEVGEVLGRAVADLDETIRQIRASIFELQEPTRIHEARARLRSVVAAAEAPLGFQPVLRLDGPIAGALEAGMLHDVTAVLREALTNVVKHAGASAVDARVTVTGPHVCVQVTDDGPAARGTEVTDAGRARAATPVGARHRGLANLASRASARGGGCSLESDERTTVLTWTARLDQ